MSEETFEMVEILKLQYEFAARALQHVVDLYDKLGVINGDQVVEYTDEIFEWAMADTNYTDEESIERVVNGGCEDDDEYGSSLQEE